MRDPVRALLKQGAAGDKGAYLALSELYFNLLCEYHYLCNCDREEALQRTETLLREGWKRLPYLKRLSDWERFLACSLLAVKGPEGPAMEEGRPQALLELESDAKFALTAFDLENWNYRWLTLALRVKPKELTRLLLEARCLVLGIDLERMSVRMRRRLEQVSADLDGRLPPRQHRRVVHQLRDCEEARTFKSRWLDCRCQLIEIRQQIRLQPEERRAFLEALGDRISAEEMLRPSLWTRVRNLFSFSELPAADILATPSDCRYSGG